MQRTEPSPARDAGVAGGGADNAPRLRIVAG